MRALVGRFWPVLPLLGLLVGFVLGAEPLDAATISHLFSGRVDEPFIALLLDWRLPRVLLAFLVGALLSVAGVLFQGLFRNPLAEPFLLGTAPGAALGAALGVLGLIGTATGLEVPLLAFVGAMTATALVLAVARITGGGGDPATLLLAGIAVAAFIGAVKSTLLLALSEESLSLQVVLSWTLGGIQTPRWDELAVLAVISTLLVGAGLPLCRGLDLLGLGEEPARSLGLAIGRFSALVMVLASLQVALAVSWGGTIGFIGLIVPHLVRSWFGPLHTGLMLRSALIGGGMLSALDGLARAAIPPADIPLGLLTALVGAPFFLVLLRRRVRHR